MADRKELVIVGFSGFGREVYLLATRLGTKIRGFLDDNVDNHGKTYGNTVVLSSVDRWTDYSDCEFVVAIGNPRVRKRVVEAMEVRGRPSYATLIDPAAIVHAEHVGIGNGSVICAGTICTVDIEIGDHVIVNINCTVGHDTVIGDFSTVAPIVAISGNVNIEERVEVGTGASIRQGISIGAGSMLGMGSVLTKSMPAQTVYFGSPAKLIKNISE